jgi:hypothetical protein
MTEGDTGCPREAKVIAEPRRAYLPHKLDHFSYVRQIKVVGGRDRHLYAVRDYWELTAQRIEKRDRINGGAQELVGDDFEPLHRVPIRSESRTNLSSKADTYAKRG